MATITIGESSWCTTFASTTGTNYVYITGQSAASGACSVDTAYAYPSSNITGFTSGVFTDNGSNEWESQAGHYVTGLAFTAGSCDVNDDFTPYSCDSGEYIGCCLTGGALYRNISDSGSFIYDSDNGCANNFGAAVGPYSIHDSRRLSYYATGTTGGGGTKGGIMLMMDHFNGGTFR